MKELTIEQKAKAYDKALERAKEFYILCKKCGAKDTVDFLEDNFPELCEPDDEKIRKTLLRWIQSNSYTNIAGMPIKNIIDWLEKQGENISLPKFTFDDILALQCCMETVKKVQEDKDLYEKLNDLHGRVYDAYHLENQGEQKSAEWSEEDEAKLKSACALIKNTSLKGNDGIVESTIDWLKSLKDKYTWKPSEAQMKALHDLNLTGNISYARQGQVLIELYNDLKRL